MYKRDGETAEEYLERIPSFGGKKIPLTQVRLFLERLGNPDREFKIFHVAGTNGKGSVCAFLTAALTYGGKSCGTFTSPHLEHVQERFAVNGVTAGNERFEQAFRTVYDAVSSWMEAGNPHPTYFEYLFYMGLVLFRQAEVEYVVLETGMGGLRDVTNVIEQPLVSVITSISIDHTAYLGNTLEEIAGHKAGIIKPGCPVVYDSACPQAAAVIDRRARELGVRSWSIKAVPYESLGDRLAIRFPYQGREADFVLPFAAPYQAVNGALAIKALEVSGAGPDPAVLKKGLETTVWPARMERIRSGVYLDGGHNEDGIRAFLDAACLIKEQKKPERTLMLFAVASDKDYRTMLSMIGGRLKPDLCCLTRMDSYRALPVETLREAAEDAMGAGIRVLCFESAGEALSRLFGEKRENDLAFIAGSLYLAGEIKKETEHD